MSTGSNKEGLLNFLVHEWSTNKAYAEKIGICVLYVTHGNTCTKLNAFKGRMTATDAVDLHSTQEEADTRMFLHSFHASADGHYSIAVFSSDTDVEVLASQHQAAIPAEIILISSTRSRSRLVSIRRFCEKLGRRLCQVLPSLHALTGCDTVSSFVGKGKKKALDLVKDDQIATDAVDLHSTQEEADMRMFLHAFHASADGHYSIAVFSSDTDVEVLASQHQAAIPAEIILISGTRSRSRLVSIRQFCEKFGRRVCQVLPSLHALTGCNTVSSFVGKGKKKALDLVKDDQIARETIQILDETIPLGEHDIIKLEKVVCKLYNEHQCDSVDELHCKMFRKGKNVQSHQLPPPRASLENHLKRANYQVCSRPSVS